jgi:hypothetical protein
MLQCAITPILVVCALTREQASGYGHGPVPVLGPVITPVALTGIEIVIVGLLVSVTVTVAGPVNEVEGLVRRMVTEEPNWVAVMLESLDAAA